MNVLMLASNLPFPPTDGWRIRTLELLKGISREHRVTLLSFSTGRPDPDSLHALGAFCDAVHFVERRPRYSPYALARGLMGRTPFTVLNYRSSRMRRKVAEILARAPCDIIHVEDIHMAQYALPIAGVPKILDMHNVESELLRRYAALQREPFRRLYARISSTKLRRYEAKHSSDFECVLTCSDVDRQLVVRRLGHPQVTVIPNGVHADQLPPEPGRDEPRTLLFVGRMDYVANDDAVLYFHREVLPRIWRAVPETRFYVVGQHPSSAVRNLADDPRIVVTGFVDDVREFLARAAVFVVPMRFGGGTRLKILEAMAMEKAIVSTTVGCEGILRSDGAIRLADSPGEFARAVIDLVLSSDRRRALGTAARKLVLREYTWSSVQERLRRLYRALAVPPGRSAPVPR